MTKENQPSQEEIWESIHAGFQFASMFPDGNIRHQWSKEYDTSILEACRIKEAFVKLALESDAPAYIVKLGANQAVDFRIDATPLADAFCGLLHQSALIRPLPAHFEPSESCKLFDQIAFSLGLDCAQATWYGISVGQLSAHNLAAVFLNGFVQRIREQGRKTSFKVAQEKRFKVAKHAIAKVGQFFRQRQELFPALCCEQVELAYWPQAATTVMPAQAARHFKEWFDEVNQTYMPRLVGDIWWRDHLPEAGFRTHLSLFFENPACIRPDLYSILQKAWYQVTETKGVLIYSGKHSREMLPALQRSIKSKMGSLAHWCLRPDPAPPHFWVSPPLRMLQTKPTTPPPSWFTSLSIEKTT